MKITAALLFLLIVLAPPSHSIAAGLPSLNHWQKQELVEAYQDGGIRLAGIILQETSACAVVHSDIDPLACGCGGTHTDTAASVVGSEVACQFLDVDWGFSIRVAALYLERCTELFGDDGGLAAYWMGIPKAKTLTSRELLKTPYIGVIHKRMHELDTLTWSTE